MPAPTPLTHSPGLTPVDFQQAVLTSMPRIAVFDCDGTLWSGDAGSGFMRWTMETGLLSAERTAWLNSRYAEYRRGNVSELAICGEMVQVYAGLPVAALRSAAAEYFQEFVTPNIFPVLEELIGSLRAHSVELWAVSSTNDWVIEAAMQRYGIPPERVLCARVAIDENERVTDRLLDVPTDQGKVDALHRSGVTAPDAVFGNSVHDAAMLGIARQAFAVNPSPALAELAAAHGWNVFHPQPSAGQ